MTVVLLCLVCLGIQTTIFAEVSVVIAARVVQFVTLHVHSRRRPISPLRSISDLKLQAIKARIVEAGIASMTVDKGEILEQPSIGIANTAQPFGGDRDSLRLK